MYPEAISAESCDSSFTQYSALLLGSEQSMKHLRVFFFFRRAGENLMGTREKDALKTVPQSTFSSVAVPNEKRNSLAHGNIFGGLSCA